MPAGGALSSAGGINMPCYLGLVLISALAPQNLVRDLPGLPAKVSVDSTFAGYGTEVLGDGKWVELDKQVTQELSHPDNLGNCGNSWVSDAVPGAEHWARVDWPRPVELNQVALWWTRPEWYPRAFRVEYLSDRNWVSLTGPGDWFVPTAQRSVLTFPAVKARAIRLLQHAGGGGERGILAVQEIEAFIQPGAQAGLQGARELAAAELRAITPVPLERNLARLHQAQPGAGRTVAWSARGQAVAAPALGDGKRDVPARLRPGSTPGVEWPIQHVLDGLTVCFAGDPPAAGKVAAQVHDGEKWVPLRAGLKRTRDAARRCVTLSCEPVATTAVRVVLPPGSPAVTEIEVSRYVPAAPDVWPDRLVQGNRYEKELLASGREPSYAELSLAALSMTPAHALLGLKDVHPETGVTWDGALISRMPIHFRFGDQREGLAGFRDTVTRRLIDGWRPGTIVSGRIRDLRVTEAAFVAYAGPGHTRPALFARVEMENLAKTPLTTSLSAIVRPRSGQATSAAGLVQVGGSLGLVGPAGAGPGKEPGELLVLVDLPAGGKAAVELIQPHGQPVPASESEAYRAVPFARALTSFRAYWDEVLAPAANIDVPEAHVMNAYRGVLTQLFINADGNVMPYGSDPGVYSGSLYGLEEGYAMMALAVTGFARHAQRYLDGTYLTPEFLVKVPTYTKYPDRHQQYRNGLQPHYAVSAYRLSRDRPWIEKHLPLLRECAEWTIAQRRTTMALENGEKPLHWGLLPKWSYGGDIADLQCYALYPNVACWRGLVDTAWLLDELGDNETAARYRAEAADYWQCIERAMDGNFLPGHKPPFLPLQLYAKGPVGDDYDQLFIGTLLHLQALDPAGRQIRYLTDFVEQDNRAFCGMPRFRRDAGAGGLDGLYGAGYLLSKLHQDRIDEFLLGFYGTLAFNLERGTFASRETNLIYASDLHVRSPYKVPDMSDPIPCSSAVALLYLRHMLVTEPPGAPGEVRLLYGVPRAWLADGQTIRLERMPSDFGEVSCEVVSRVKQGRIEATVTPPARGGWERLALRLRHPAGSTFRGVLVNGQPAADVDSKREVVVLRPGADTYRVVAQY